MTALSLAIDTPDLAQHYETVSADRQFRHGLELLEQLGLSQGQRVLDVGCGTGLLAEYAASVVAPSGAVVGIDPLPLRIEIARQKATAQLSFEVGDANRLDRFPAATFDVAYLNAVFHWLPEKRSAAERDILAEFERLREPQGVPQQGTRIVAIARKPASH